MAHYIGDLLKETASAGGTGNFTLTGAVAGFRAFSSKLTTNGDTTWYVARNGAEWELGVLTRVSSTVYARSVEFSSNSDALVNFSAAPTVFSNVPASAFRKSMQAPVFRVYRTGDLTSWPTGVYGKVSFNSKSFDPEGWFDNTVNFRYTPQIAGWYHFNWRITGVGVNVMVPSLFKNDVIASLGSVSAPYSGFDVVNGGSDEVYLNGSTDYVDVRVYATNSGRLSGNSLEETYFSGHLLRAA